MPCTISEEEEEYYEREYNKKHFGLEVTNDGLTTAAACAMGKKLEELGAMKDMPPYVKLWFEKHKKFDEEQKKKEKKPGG